MSSSPPETLCMGDQPMFDMSDLFRKVLHSIIARLMKDWSPGVRGVSKNLLFNDDGKLQVSMGVASVIRDYIDEMPATFGQDLDSQQQKVRAFIDITSQVRYQRSECLGSR